MKSNCCNSELVYVIAGNFKLDYIDFDERMINPGKTYYYECGKCNQACDVLESKQ